MLKQLLLLILVSLFLGLTLLFYNFDAPSSFYISSGTLFAVLMLFLNYRRHQIEHPKFDNPSNPSEPPLTDILPQQRLLNELEMAKRVQENLLNVASPKVRGIRIAKRCVPAKSIGGDFYTFIRKDFPSLSARIEDEEDSDESHLGIAIGDVAGHGVSSALIMALTSGIMTEIGKQEASPAKVFEQVNDELIKYIQNSHITHVTAFYAVLNTETKLCQFVRAGHPSAFLLRDKDIQRLDSPGVFLGMFNDQTYENKQIQLETGDKLVFYTDGITETKDQKGEFYSEERLIDQLLQHNKKPIGQIVNDIYQDVDTFSNHQVAKDDRSMIIVEVC